MKKYKTREDFNSDEEYKLNKDIVTDEYYEFQMQVAISAVIAVLLTAIAFIAKLAWQYKAIALKTIIFGGTIILFFLFMRKVWKIAKLILLFIVVEYIKESKEEQFWKM